MIAGELAHLAGEMHAAIGEQDFGLADAAGIEDDLAGRGIAGVVLVGDAEVEIAERHPHALAAPAHMDRLALERHRLLERGAGFRREFLLEAGVEGEVTGANDQLAHAVLFLGSHHWLCRAAYSGCRRSYDQPNSPCVPRRGAAGGGGGGAVSSNRACGGETGAGMLSHFME